MPFVVGPFDDDPDGGFRPPTGHEGAAFDLSPDVSAFLHQSVPSDWRPTGIFYFPDTQAAQAIGADPTYRVIGSGGDTLDQASRDLFNQLTGHTPSTSEEARVALYRAVDEFASGDDSATDRQKVFGPTGGSLKLVIGNTVAINQAITTRHMTEWMRCKSLDLESAATSGDSARLESACKEVGFLLGQWPASQSSDWITATAASAGLVATTPATTITDDFSGTLSAWTTKGGSMSIVSGAARGTTNGGDNWMVHQTALSSADHYAEAVVDRVGSGNLFTGPFSRQDNSSTITYYQAATGGSSTQGRFLYKYVSGVPTSLSYSSGLAFGETIRMDSDGSTQSAIYSTSADLSASDSTISSGTYTGLRSYNYSTEDSTFDDFEASDTVAEPSNNLLAAIHHYNQGQM